MPHIELTYWNAFRAADIKKVPIPLDEEGMSLEGWEPPPIPPPPTLPVTRHHNIHPPPPHILFSSILSSTLI